MQKDKKKAPDNTKGQTEDKASDDEDGEGTPQDMLMSQDSSPEKDIKGNKDSTTRRREKKKHRGKSTGLK